METWLVFRQGESWLALLSSEVKEVLPLCQLCHPPGLGGLLSGFLNLEGRLLPAVSLARMLGQEGPVGQQLLLSSPLVVQVEAVEGVFQVTPRPLEAGYTFNDWAVARATLADRLVYRLAADRLLLAEERARLEDLGRQHQERLKACET